MTLWYVVDGKVKPYCWQETDGKWSFLVRADTAEVALMKYEKFQQGKWRKEIIDVGGRTIAALL